MTSGCMKQACSYRDHQGNLTSANAIVVGIRGDTPENLKLWLRDTENRASLKAKSRTLASVLFNTHTHTGKADPIDHFEPEFNYTSGQL
jgi:hypothetical protein